MSKQLRYREIQSNYAFILQAKHIIFLTHLCTITQLMLHINPIIYGLHTTLEKTIMVMRVSIPPSRRNLHLRRLHYRRRLHLHLPRRLHC